MQLGLGDSGIDDGPQQVELGRGLGCLEVGEHIRRVDHHGRPADRRQIGQHVLDAAAQHVRLKRPTQLGGVAVADDTRPVAGVLDHAVAFEELGVSEPPAAYGDSLGQERAQVGPDLAGVVRHRRAGEQPDAIGASNQATLAIAPRPVHRARAPGRATLERVRLVRDKDVEPPSEQLAPHVGRGRQVVARDHDVGVVLEPLRGGRDHLHAASEQAEPDKLSCPVGPGDRRADDQQLARADLIGCPDRLRRLAEAHAIEKQAGAPLREELDPHALVAEQLIVRTRAIGDSGG